MLLDEIHSRYLCVIIQHVRRNIDIVQGDQLNSSAKIKYKGNVPILLELEIKNLLSFPLRCPRTYQLLCIW